jgi:hypothetical protein
LPYTRICNCLLDYGYVLHIVNFAILYRFYVLTCAAFHNLTWSPITCKMSRTSEYCNFPVIHVTCNYIIILLFAYTLLIMQYDWKRSLRVDLRFFTDQRYILPMVIMVKARENSQSQHLGPFPQKCNFKSIITGYLNFMHNKHCGCTRDGLRHQDNTVYVRITWLGVHALFNLQAAWRMNKVKLWKTCLRTEIVWICFT